ncbi:dihydrofolate reductase family protein [Streptosporangium sp. NPDC002721]|uniref:dihydrofolate reductase family protein n=1 Tax=Streptosporangium sp. NPDC002721 TaxID=3366188 RepID=UPI00368017E5
MRKLVYFVASTLDGFVAGPDGSDPTGPGGFWSPSQDYVSHLVEEYPETLPGPARAALGVTAEGVHFDTVLEGRKSYEIGLAAGVTNAYPHLRHLVFSRTLTKSPDPGVELVATDPVAAVRELKREGGKDGKKGKEGKDVWLVGGGELAGTLHGEIDRLIVKLNPLTVGTGIPLLGRSAVFAPTAWELAGHTVLESGVAFLTYDRRPGTPRSSDG